LQSKRSGSPFLFSCSFSILGLGLGLCKIWFCQEDDSDSFSPFAQAKGRSLIALVRIDRCCRAD
jgi:hypothetical protein